MNAFREWWQTYGLIGLAEIKSLSPAERLQHLFLLRNVFKLLDEAAALLKDTHKVRSFGDTLPMRRYKRLCSVTESLGSCSYQLQSANAELSALPVSSHKRGIR